jgi:hypothetical protein
MNSIHSSWAHGTRQLMVLRHFGSLVLISLLALSRLASHVFAVLTTLVFVVGTSSTLFSQFLLEVNKTDIPSFIITALRTILTDLGEANDDIVQYHPNPFCGYNIATSRVADLTQLTLVDGREDLQNIPLNPLIQPYRAVDVIFAVDSSADTTYY